MARLTLAAIAASCVEVEITLAGERLKARPLTAAQMADVLAAAGPRPEPPLKPDLDRGSKAPPVPDERDEAYVAATLAWQTGVRAATVAGAILAADPGQVDLDLSGGAEAWSVGSVRKLAAALAHARHTELVEAWDAVTGSRGDQPTAAEAAEGN